MSRARAVSSLLRRATSSPASSLPPSYIHSLVCALGTTADRTTASSLTHELLPYLKPFPHNVTALAHTLHVAGLSGEGEGAHPALRASIAQLNPSQVSLRQFRLLTRAVPADTPELVALYTGLTRHNAALPHQITFLRDLAPHAPHTALTAHFAHLLAHPKTPPMAVFQFIAYHLPADSLSLAAYARNCDLGNLCLAGLTGFGWPDACIERARARLPRMRRALRANLDARATPPPPYTWLFLTALVGPHPLLARELAEFEVDDGDAYALEMLLPAVGRPEDLAPILQRPARALRAELADDTLLRLAVVLRDPLLVAEALKWERSIQPNDLASALVTPDLVHVAVQEADLESLEEDELTRLLDVMRLAGHAKSAGPVKRELLQRPDLSAEAAAMALQTLVVLDDYDADVFRALTDIVRAEHPAALDDEILGRLAYVDVALAIERPEWELVGRCPAQTLPSSPTSSSALHREISAALTARGVEHENEAPVLHAGGFMAADMLLLGPQVVVEVDGPTHFLPTGELDGPTKCKQRLLETLGYKVVRVGYKEWRRGEGLSSENGEVLDRIAGRGSS